jgi:hypothetical protein
MYTESKHNYGLISTTLLVAILAGCVSTEPVRVEADYGKSVKQMVQAQTYNPEAAARTESIPIKEMDGVMAVDTLNAMRKDVTRDTKILNNVINVQLGAGGNN